MENSNEEKVNKEKANIVIVRIKMKGYKKYKKRLKNLRKQMKKLSKISKKLR